MKKLFLWLGLLGFTNLLFPQDVARDTPPVPGEVQELKLPEVRHFRLSNGLSVYLIENNALPLVQFQLMLNAGSIFDPPDKTGLSNLVFDLMDEQTADMSPEVWADTLQFLGVELDAFSRAEQAGIRLFTPLSRVERALDLMAALLLRSHFPEGAIERKKETELLRLSQEYSNARLLAGVAMRQLLYGEDHPLGKRFSGTAESLRSIVTSDIQRFFDTMVRPHNAYLVVAGAVDETTLRGLLEDRLGDWKGGDWHPLGLSVQPAEARTTRFYVIDLPEKTQAELRLVQLGPGAATPDYQAIQVMNTILGGVFSSRLNLSLRERKGLTYGAASGFYFPEDDGYFVAQATVKAEVTGLAVQAFMDEFDRIADIEEDEFNRAANYLMNSFPKKFESLQSWVEEVSRIVCYRLSHDFLCTYNNALQQLQPAQAVAAAKKYIRPNNMLALAVGDRRVIEPQLRALNLGPVEVLEATAILGEQP